MEVKPLFLKVPHFLFTFWFNISRLVFFFFPSDYLPLCLGQRIFEQGRKIPQNVFFFLFDIYVQEAVIFKPLYAFFKHPDIQFNKKS